MKCDTTNCNSEAKHRVVGDIPAEDKRRVLWFCDRHAPQEAQDDE